MSHDSTEHHLEEAHHAGHASLDNFTRNVAMTMAIIAAGLAFITLLSHRQHNATLQLQIKSNDNLTEASNRWAGGGTNDSIGPAGRLSSDGDFAVLVERDGGQLAVVLGEMDGRNDDVVFEQALGRQPGNQGL